MRGKGGHGGSRDLYTTSLGYCRAVAISSISPTRRVSSLTMSPSNGIAPPNAFVMHCTWPSAPFRHETSDLAVLRVPKPGPNSQFVAEPAI